MDGSPPSRLERVVGPLPGNPRQGAQTTTCRLILDDRSPDVTAKKKGCREPRAKARVLGGRDLEFGLPVGFVHADRETAADERSEHDHAAAKHASEQYGMRVPAKDQPEAEGVDQEWEEPQESAIQNCGQEVAAVVNREVSDPDPEGKLHDTQNGRRKRALQLGPDGFQSEV
jgi:hypothetical protein